LVAVQERITFYGKESISTVIKIEILGSGNNIQIRGEIFYFLKIAVDRFD